MAARRMLFELANRAAADVAAQAASGAASSPPTADDDAVPSEPKLDGRSPSRSPDADVAGSPAGSAASRSTASTTVMWESDEEADENQPAAEARESESQQPEEAKVEPEGDERLAPPLKEDKETETGVSAVATDRAPTDTLPSQPQVSLSPLKPSLKVSSPNSKRTSEDGMISPRRRSGRSLSSNSSPPSTGDKLTVSPCFCICWAVVFAKPSFISVKAACSHS
ncbi:unnamed protein product [Dibothriocephalus latus]|uniref:Uncharacterized protein n=1 Tax=Dibothriocephalus latus TaxID=60516 RepID=A0A3P7Q4D8_DIBLA|nr:unnamed protein product [Dibothriocephalus latus]